MPFDLDLTAANPLLDRVRAVFSPAVADQILLAAGTKVGLKAEEVVQDNLYPPASGKALPLWYTRERKDGTTYKSKFKSLAQQRFVMALVARGGVPYRRTGNLGRSIVSRARLTGAGLLMIDIGSIRYGLYVINRPTQSHYHMGTWQTVQDDIEAALPDLQRVGVNTVIKEVNRRIQNG